MKFVLLQKAQTGSNDLGLVVKPPGRYEALNHLLKMWSYDLTHIRGLQQFGTVVKAFKFANTNPQPFHHPSLVRCRQAKERPTARRRLRLTELPRHVERRNQEFGS